MTTKQLERFYIKWFGVTVLLLALVRWVFGLGGSPSDGAQPADIQAYTDSIDIQTRTDSIAALVGRFTSRADSLGPRSDIHVADDDSLSSRRRYRADGERLHRIYSVPNYDTTFPDSNHVQLAAARRWGVQPLRDRADVEQRKDQLVSIELSPFYSVDRLSHSIPYLVPHAAALLQDIGRNFMDSLHAKGLPLHRCVITSVLRTESDVRSLRRTNHNATEQSCHLYGTTLDISYTHFETVQAPGGPHRRTVSDDTLKYVLSEVLNDLRRQERCYVKYEHRQSCFHLTVR